MITGIYIHFESSFPCLQIHYRIGWIRMLAKLKENIDKYCKENQKSSNKGEMYQCI